MPKLSIIIRKSYGIGYNVMLQPLMTADFVVAWPTASVSFVHLVIGVELVYGKKLEQSPIARKNNSDSLKNGLSMPLDLFARLKVDIVLEKPADNPMF